VNTFNGSARATVEENGRLSLPKKFYYAIDANERDELYLTIERDPCILVYPKSRWEERMRKLSAQDMEEDPEIMRKVRLLQRKMRPVKVDKQGRFYLPTDLKEKVGIGRNVEILGAITRMEIWAPEKLDEYEESGPGVF
jgi:MraZ protein